MSDNKAYHWEHGYRTHGYWTEDNVQVARIGLPMQRFMKDNPFPYHVTINPHTDLGQFKTLRVAKRIVEEWFKDKLR